MTNKTINFCPYCGKRIRFYIKDKLNYCCFCGKKLKVEKHKIISQVQCTICHIKIDPDKDKTIKCSFCGSTYHYRCVYSWLQNYNACPMCQNVFLFPNKSISIVK